MRRPAQLTSIALSLTAGLGLAHAAQGGAHDNRTVGSKIASYTRYFSKAHAAVVQGGVTPHATLGIIGPSVSLGWSLGVGVGGGVVTTAGMDQKIVVARGFAGLGLQTGVSGYQHEFHFASRGADPKDLIPKAEGYREESLILGETTGARNASTKSAGIVLGFSTGFSSGYRATGVMNVGKPTKSTLLRQLEEGADAAAQITALRDKGVAEAAPEIQRLVTRMEFVRTQIATEKAAFNKMRRRIQRR